MRFHPLIQYSSHYFSQLKQVCCSQTFTSTKHHITSLYSHFCVQLALKVHFCRPTKKWKFLRFFVVIIGECGSTLYVGLAHAVLLTDTKFKPLLLPTQTGSVNRQLWTRRFDSPLIFLPVSPTELKLALKEMSNFPLPDVYISNALLESCRMYEHLNMMTSRFIIDDRYLLSFSIGIILMNYRLLTSFLKKKYC